ncbi:hypothetical protein ACFL6F_03330 [Planctomycetota bacterium]
MILAQADFDAFEPGPYPHEYTPLPEMYCLYPKGKTGGWHEPVTGFAWKEYHHWKIEEQDGKHCLMQVMEYTHKLDSILVKGDTLWKDVNIKSTISFNKDPKFVGVLFRYTNSFDYYAAGFVDSRLQVIKKDIHRVSVITAVEYSGNNEDVILEVTCKGNDFEILVNGRKNLEFSDTMHPHGKAGVIAASPAVFYDFEVSCSDRECKRIEKETKSIKARIANKSKKYPGMKLWKEVTFGNYVGGKAFRFGDLTGNGMYDILCAQVTQKAEIACLTAVDLDGNIIWQKGSPIDDPLIITGDTPMQIVDFDGRGKNDVLTVLDGRIELIDGESGEMRRTGKLPEWPERNEQAVHIGGSWFSTCINTKEGGIVPNYIRPCNLTGKKKGFDFICGHGYPYLWGFNNELEQLWFYTGNVGHFATTYDTNGDGRDEIQAGYSSLNSDGRWNFSLHLQDHADAVLIMPHNHPAGELMRIAAGGEDGLMFFDDKGWFHQILKGHVQHISIGKFRKDLPGLQFATVTYHGNPGIITIYDKDGNELMSKELPCAGPNLQPVNWTGEGEELILFSGHREIGGLMDAEGDIVVEFPDKDHPQLWCESIRFQGDARDEIIVFDQERMHIYTPDTEFKGNKIYAPERAPLACWSNFMAHYSYPKWMTL